LRTWESSVKANIIISNLTSLLAGRRCRDKSPIEDKVRVIVLCDSRLDVAFYCVGGGLVTPAAHIVKLHTIAGRTKPLDLIGAVPWRA
jgi:hypothetical protein